MGKTHLRPAGSALGVQDVVVCQGQSDTLSMLKDLENQNNDIDETFYDAVKI